MSQLEGTEEQLSCDKLYIGDLEQLVKRVACLRSLDTQVSELL